MYKNEREKNKRNKSIKYIYLWGQGINGGLELANSTIPSFDGFWSRRLRWEGDQMTGDDAAFCVKATIATATAITLVEGDQTTGDNTAFCIKAAIATAVAATITTTTTTTTTATLL